MKAEKVIALLIGIATSLLFVCAAAGLTLTSATDETTILDASAPSPASVQADLSELYLNRTFLANASSFDSPMPISGGSLDIRPGNRIAFRADIDSPIGPLTATGTVVLTVQDGLLDIRVETVSVGRLPATQLMRLYMPGIDAQITSMANRQLLERAGQAGLKLDAITTDNDTLHVYLTGLD